VVAKSFFCPGLIPPIWYRAVLGRFLTQMRFMVY
jgi:hypothetical protein